MWSAFVLILIWFYSIRLPATTTKTVFTLFLVRLHSSLFFSAPKKIFFKSEYFECSCVCLCISFLSLSLSIMCVRMNAKTVWAVDFPYFIWLSEIKCINVDQWKLHTYVYGGEYIGNVLRLAKQNSQVSSSISVLTDIETVLSYQSLFFSQILLYSTTLSIRFFHVSWACLIRRCYAFHSWFEWGFDFMALPLLLDSVAVAANVQYYRHGAPLSIFLQRLVKYMLKKV